MHAKTIFKVALPTCREIQIKFYLFLVKSTRRRSNQHAAMGRFLNPPNMHDNSPDYLISVLCRAIVTDLTDMNEPTTMYCLQLTGVLFTRIFQHPSEAD